MAVAHQPVINHGVNIVAIRPWCVNGVTSTSGVNFRIIRFRCTALVAKAEQDFNLFKVAGAADINATAGE